MKKLVTIILIMQTAFTINAQPIIPVSSDQLIHQGISPGILQFAANSVLQEGNFKEDVSIAVSSDGKEEVYQLQYEYDPSNKYGFKIRLLDDLTETSKKDAKLLSEAIKNLHHFSRLTEQFQYDDSSIKSTTNADGELVFRFYYRKAEIEPGSKYATRLKGYIHFNNEELDHVELVNMQPLTKGVYNHNIKTFFDRSANGVNYYATKVVESFNVAKGGKIYNVNVEATINQGAEDEHDSHILSYSTAPLR